MTDEEIDAMGAGEDIDHAIAEDIFGFPVFREQKDGKLYLGASRMHHEWRELPPYSTDIAAAWQVLEWLKRQDKLSDFCEYCPICDSTPWDWCGYSAAEMSLIICRAALKCCKAVGKEA